MGKGLKGHEEKKVVFRFHKRAKIIQNTVWRMEMMKFWRRC